MTLDEMISVFKNGDLQDIDYELMINAEQLLYWLTEYRAMISVRHSDNLSERLAEHLVWAESNSYECPLTLAEDLQEAISTLAKEKMQMQISNEMIVERDCVIDGMENEINRLQSASSWIPVEDRMPDKNPNEHQIVYTKGKMTGITSYGKYDSTDGKWVILGSEVTHWMLMPDPPKGGTENAEN